MSCRKRFRYLYWLSKVYFKVINAYVNNIISNFSHNYISLNEKISISTANIINLINCILK